MQRSSNGDSKTNLMRSLSIVIPALNEHRNIVLTVDELIPYARKELEKFQITLVNDGSSDGTGEAMDKLAEKYPEIQVIHHPQRLGVGASYREGIDRAHLNYVTLIPGDHICSVETWEPLFRAVGQADLVIGYRVNQNETRHFHRVILSKLYTFMMDVLFGLRLKDFHGLVIYPLDVIREARIQSSGYTYQLEALVYMHRHKKTIIETPLIMIPSNPSGKTSSRSLRPQTFFDLAKTIWLLLIHQS